MSITKQTFSVVRQACRDLGGHKCTICYPVHQGEQSEVTLRRGKRAYQFIVKPCLGGVTVAFNEMKKQKVKRSVSATFAAIDEAAFKQFVADQLPSELLSADAPRPVGFSSRNAIQLDSVRNKPFKPHKNYKPKRQMQLTLAPSAPASIVVSDDEN